MADTKLSALTELAATPANDDEVYIRDVSEIAADESKRITVVNLIAGAGGAADFPMKLKPALTRYVIPGWYINGVTNIQAGVGRIYYIPIFVEETTTYIRICVYVGTSDVGSADLRIFEWDNGVPGALILSAGTVDTGSTGAKEITISQELTRGYYFLAVRCSAIPWLWGSRTIDAISPPLAGFLQGSQPKASAIILAVSTTYTDPAPAPDSDQNANYALVYLREN